LGRSSRRANYRKLLTPVAEELSRLLLEGDLGIDYVTPRQDHGRLREKIIEERRAEMSPNAAGARRKIKDKNPACKKPTTTKPYTPAS
jgi:hypothetical protein